MVDSQIENEQLQHLKEDRERLSSRPSSPNWYPTHLSSMLPSWPYFGGLPSWVGRRDVLRDLYAPPLADTRYPIPVPVPVRHNIGIPPSYGMMVPSMNTNIGAVNAAYRQMGILTPTNGSNTDKILSLMGRPVYTNRDKWQYYTISNQNNGVKLPISVKGKSGSGEYGVDIIYNGDTVYVEGLNESHTATIYDTDTIQYMPY
jgi:hypothetical protein